MSLLSNSIKFKLFIIALIWSANKMTEVSDGPKRCIKETK
jgi:hypothetical protein